MTVYCITIHCFGIIFIYLRIHEVDNQDMCVGDTNGIFSNLLWATQDVDD